MKSDNILTLGAQKQKQTTYFCKNKFFENEFYYSIIDNKLYFKRVNLNWGGRIYKLQCRDGYYRSSVKGLFDSGDYALIEEESNEDQLVFDLKEKVFGN